MFSSPCCSQCNSSATTRQAYNRYSDKSLMSKVKTWCEPDDEGGKANNNKEENQNAKTIPCRQWKTFIGGENNSGHISYHSFCRLRPFWVVHPSLTDRDTCQCRLHENQGFLSDKLCQFKLIVTSNFESLTELVCCDIGSKACMYGECEDCKNRIIPFSSSYNGAQKVTYMQWATEDKAKSNDGQSSVAKITVKQTI